MSSHQKKIEQIAIQLKKFTKQQTNSGKNQRKHRSLVKFKRGGISHKVPFANESSPKKLGGNSSSSGSNGPTMSTINVPPLNKIIKIDVKNRTCTAESGVTFTDLVKKTLKHNLVPYTVPELKTITIGGAVSGCSVESMSYKHGGFHDSCLEYELITASGEVITCSRDTPEAPAKNGETRGKNEHIFNMVHGAFGTIGLLTKLKFRLHPAKPYIHIENRQYTTFGDYSKAIQSHYKKQDVDFMDGIIHGPNHFTLCIGTFVSKAPYMSNYEGQEIYYKSTRDLEEDYLTTHDYFFRYDTECHWISRNYGMENPILRKILGRHVLSSTKMISLSQKLKPLFRRLKPDVVIDVFVPFSNFEIFWEFYKKEISYYPLWIVPYRIKDRYPWINDDFMEGIDDELFIDCAIYGLKQKYKDYYHLLDEELFKLQGIKTLISHNSYDEKTFWKIYNQSNYQKVKTRTDPYNIFRDLYEKTHDIKK